MSTYGPSFVIRQHDGLSLCLLSHNLRRLRFAGLFAESSKSLMWPFTAWSEGIDIAETVRLKRDRQAEAITQGLTLAGQSDGDGPFLSADASEIVSRIRSREWTSRRVMEAYIRSSARVHERTNCLTEIMYSQALEESSRLDAWISNASDTELDSKLLLGLPMSLKDQLNVKGYDSTIGFVRYASTFPDYISR